jgi:hypothetical protein
MQAISRTATHQAAGGGAIFLGTLSVLSLANSTFQANSAESSAAGSGGAIYGEGGSCLAAAANTEFRGELWNPCAVEEG